MFSSLSNISRDDSDSDDELGGFLSSQSREISTRSVYEDSSDSEEEGEDESSDQIDLNEATVNYSFLPEDKKMGIFVKQTGPVGVNSVVFVPPKHAICSQADDVVQWDLSKGYEYARSRHHEEDEKVRQIVKWNGAVFLSAGNDSKVFATSIRTRQNAKEFGFYGRCLRILKIDEDLFVVLTDMTVFIVSYINSKVVKRVDIKRPEVQYHTTSRLHSPKSKHKARNSSFFVLTTFGKSKHILLVDHRMGEDHVKTMFDFENSERTKIYCLDSFLQPSFSNLSSLDEILVAGGSDGRFYFYNMWDDSLSKIDTKYQKYMKYQTTIKRKKAFRIVSLMILGPTLIPSSVLTIGNRYVVFGTENGRICHFSLENLQTDADGELVGTSKESFKFFQTQQKKVNEISLHFRGSDALQIITCGTGTKENRMQLVRIAGLDLVMTKEMEMYMQNDIEERFLFLLEYLSDDAFGYEEEEEDGEVERIGILKVQLHNTHVFGFASTFC